MDVNSFLVGAICLSCLLFLIRAVRASVRRNLGWIIISATVASISIILLQMGVAIASPISFSLWAVLLLLPSFGYAVINRLIFQQQYGSARRLAQILRWLHPVDGWWEQPQILLALQLAHAGKLAQAEAIFQRCRRHNHLGLVAQVMLYWMQADWQECALWMEQHIPESKLNGDNRHLAIYYLRALGETGKLDALVAGLNRLETQLSIAPFQLNLVRMFTLAFCGQTAAVSYLFKNILSNYSRDTQKFWLATAQMAAGSSKAQLQLENLYPHTNPLLQRAIDWRLSHPLANPAQLSPTSQIVLTQIQQDLSQENKYRKLNNQSFKRTFATYTIIAINLIVFGLEIHFGGSENIDTLYLLGGLDPNAVIQGEWWRLITANFLHFGWLHLATNMAGLLFFAPFVELNLGSLRFILIYFLTGATAMLAFTYVAIQTNSYEQILVGASAAIMGIIGVTIAILIRDLRLAYSRMVTRKLRLLIFIVLLQFGFDLFTPQVSFLSHLLGLITGLLVGIIIMFNFKSHIK